MKNSIFLTIITLGAFFFISCSNDDDTVLPTPVNEEEIITTITVTLTPVGSGATVILKTQDLDGDGPNAPVTTVSDTLMPDTTYNAVVQFLDETKSPAENITEEVEEESNEHQLFYVASESLDITTEYSNFDTNGNPLGTEFVINTGVTSNGLLTITLRHEPVKPNTGIGNAGGETDIESSFNIAIQ